MNSRRPAPVRRLVVPGALLLAASFALVGCGQSTGAADKDKMGPISARFDKLYGSSGQEQWNDMQTRYEEVVASCMKEKGFEYTPVPADVSGGMVVEPSADENYDPVADAKTNGYYITPATKADLIANYGLDNSTPDDTATAPPEDGSIAPFPEGDPNINAAKLASSAVSVFAGQQPLRLT